MVEAHASAIGRGRCLADAFLDEDTTMKIPIPRTVLCIALLAASASGANAQTTRAEVRAAYAEAVRTGDVMAPGDSGLKLNELYPQRYPRAPAASGRTREEVKAELAQAVREGDVVAAGELELTARELHPERYPAAQVVALGKTRAQVKAETREAIATGDMFASGEGQARLNEQYPQRYARARALLAARAPSDSMR